MSQNYGNKYRTPDIDRFDAYRTHCAARMGERGRLGNIGEVHWLAGDENFEERSLQISTRPQSELLRTNPAGPIAKGESPIAWQG